MGEFEASLLRALERAVVTTGRVLRVKLAQNHAMAGGRRDPFSGSPLMAKQLYTIDLASSRGGCDSLGLTVPR
jgi:hypothetical protein